MQQTPEQDLRDLFAGTSHHAPAGEFVGGVRRRIRMLRRAQRIGSAVCYAALVAIILIASPYLLAAATQVTETSALLTTALSEVIATPAAFAIGIAAALLALLDLRHFR